MNQMKVHCGLAFHMELTHVEWISSVLWKWHEMSCERFLMCFSQEKVSYLLNRPVSLFPETMWRYFSLRSGPGNCVFHKEDKLNYPENIGHILTSVYPFYALSHNQA
jgi:hypothetical protein